MIVIVWDGKTLAADKRMTDGGGMARTVTKIQRHENVLLAWTGALDTGLELREWFKAGAVPAAFPAKAREDIATLVVISAGKVETYNASPNGVRIEADRCAFGSGRDYAEAAMYCGRDAAEAAAIACRFQCDCGNGIDTLEL